jgi:hypothetical protein
VDVLIDEIDIGALDAVAGYVEPRIASSRDDDGPRLLIVATDGTRVLADATSEQIDLFEMVWRATTDESESATLVDLRAACAAMKARWTAQLQMNGQAGFTQDGMQ